MDTIIALVVFIVCYIAFLHEKINRAVVACAGGTLLLLLGIVDLNDAFIKHIDWHTVALLFSMMILVTITNQSGVFTYIAVFLAKRVGGSPLALLFVISVFTGVGSALLDNVTTVLLIVPIVFTLTKMLEIDVVPFLTAVILFSNIGGTATMIGDPPNVMIGQVVPELTFNDFLFNLAPPAIVTFFVVFLILAVLYRKNLQVHAQHYMKLASFDPRQYLHKGTLLYKSLTVLTLTISAFLLHPILNVDLTVTALAGAMLLMLITQHEQKADDVFRSLEWVTLFFFIGLFTLIGGLKDVGVIDEMARGILAVTGGDLSQTALLILWGSGILSGFLDNIPFVAAMIPVVFEFEQYGIDNLEPIWWALALGSCLGGNGTIIGASANVIVAGLAVKENISFAFVSFMKVGMLVVLLSLLISTAYLYAFYL